VELKAEDQARLQAILTGLEMSAMTIGQPKILRALLNAR
jgi:hypothetical protein